MDECEIAPGQFVEPREDAAIVLHEAEHDLDLAPGLVERPVGGARFDAVGMRWNDGFDVLLVEPFEHVVRIIGPVGEDGAGVAVVGRLEQRQGLRRVAGLTGCQDEAQGIAEAVAEAMQLAGEAAA